MSAAGIIEITGQPVKEVVFTPGGVPAKVDPNGKYQVEQMYVQYFLPQNTQGQAAAAAVARRRTDRRHLRDQAGRRRRLDATISSATAGTPTCPTRWSAAAPAGPDTFKGDADLPAVRRSVGALPHRPDRLVERRPGEARDLSGHAVSRPRPIAQFMKQGVPRWVTTDDADRHGLHRTGRQGLPLRRAGAQPGRHVRLQGRSRRGPTRSRRWSRSSRRSAATRARSRRAQGHADADRVSATTPRIIRAGRRSARTASTMRRRFKAAGGSVDLRSICPTPASRAIRT